MKFRAPKSVKVGGTRYEIIREAGFEHKSGAVGRISYWKSTIHLDTEYSESNSLMHELVHALTHDHRIELDEEDTERMARGLLALIADNPRLIHRLADVLGGKP